MKILLLGVILLLTACGQHDSDGLRATAPQETADDLLAGASDALAVAEVSKIFADRTGETPVPQTRMDQSFAQVKDQMKTRLACGTEDEIAFSRPTKASYISVGSQRFLVALDKANLLTEDEVALDDSSPVRRVFSQIEEGRDQKTGKLALALLVLPEDYLLEEKAKNLQDKGYWEHHALALMAFQCVDANGKPTSPKAGVKVSEHYLTFAEDDAVRLELTRTKDQQFILRAQRNQWLDKTTFMLKNSSGTQPIKFGEVGKGSDPENFTLSYFVNPVVSSDLARALRDKEDSLAQKFSSLQEGLVSSQNSQKANQEKIDELKKSGNTGLKGLLDLGNLSWRKWEEKSLNGDIDSYTSQISNHFKVLRGELALLGDF